LQVGRGCTISNAASDQAHIADTAATQDATNAGAAYGQAQGDIGNYLSNVNSALAAGNPFESKDYLTQQNLETSGAMNSENDAAKQQEQATVARTGTNSAALSNDVAENARAGQRDLTQYNAGRDTSNENTWLNQQDKLLGDEATGSSEEAGLYGTSVGAQDSTLNTAQQGEDEQENANDQMIDAGIAAAGATGAAFCPARGSLYLLANGSQRPVEELKVGDRLYGIDGEPQTIEEIQSAVFPVLRITFSNGNVVRNSKTHAFALPYGGFTVAARSMGKSVLTATGIAQVTRIDLDGEDELFNVITDGSHTYQADGVWALGVGEAERQVTMDEWGKIGNRIKVG
jgi:hypothetical protein